MKIKVTQDHIDHGLRGSCMQCPVALALRDAGFLAPFAGVENIHVQRKFVTTPDTVQEFMKLFDNGLPCEPFTFEIGL